jgi:hypothetical protein
MHVLQSGVSGVAFLHLFHLSGNLSGFNCDFVAQGLKVAGNKVVSYSEVQEKIV